MNYELMLHAKGALAEREIPIAGMERALTAPELCLPDPDDAFVERRYCRIPEHGGWVLRVAVNIAVEPVRVVSVFFDREMKDRL